MKKLGAVLILSLLILSVITASFYVKADDIPGMPAALNEQNLDKINQGIDNTQAGASYLQSEWKKVLLENKVVFFIDSLFTKLSPVFKFSIGYDYSLSWAFFFALLIWVAIIIIIYSPIKNYLFFEKKWMAFIVAIITATLISETGTMKIIINFLSFYLTSAVYMAIAFVIILLIVTIYATINKTFGARYRASLKKGSEERKAIKEAALETINDLKLKEAGIKP